ncbi:tryptophan synthase alpha chain [Frondihabitans sp. PhB188]|uniref:tryptophan synthase subunit alpha n=1 Tax=Frondihabitans sp. PhB188 TaxID=2485200 RepID=UPI000F4964BE|nr:tryptophan synthase subunit alpha [Frondihabitans sp. PhB188]ROQ41014.1 tryptophan synthase alpha chain [Frondihabitans sp. PhB188]
MISTSSKLGSAIHSRTDAGSGAVIGYLPAGFPDLQTSIDAAVTLVNNGVDVIELGLPYSDPVMDGPVIQAATQRALAEGFRVRDVFPAVREITSQVAAPVVVMTYWNPVSQYGAQRFADDLASAGGAGLITPDLVPDEGAEWIAAANAADLDRVFLAAPSSSDARVAQAVEASRGFVYTVSTMGITGTREGVDSAAAALVARLRAAGVDNACVGLGISTAQQVREVLEYADGAIIGSAFVRALAEGGLEQLARVSADLASGSRVS